MCVVVDVLFCLGVDGFVVFGFVMCEGDDVILIVFLCFQLFVDVDGVGEWWIVSDFDEVVFDGLLFVDYVFGVGGVLWILVEMVVFVQVDCVFDLGMGCGIQVFFVFCRV